MDREESRFAFWQEKFPWISMEKLKVGIFDSSQIRELMKDLMFDIALSKVELSVWQWLKSVVTNFLGKPPECWIWGENWRVTEEFLPIQGMKFSHTWTIFQRTVEIWVKSRVSTFTKTFALWKNATKASEM